MCGALAGDQAVHATVEVVFGQRPLGEGASNVATSPIHASPGPFVGYVPPGCDAGITNKFKVFKQLGKYPPTCPNLSTGLRASTPVQVNIGGASGAWQCAK